MSSLICDTPAKKVAPISLSHTVSLSIADGTLLLGLLCTIPSELSGVWRKCRYVLYALCTVEHLLSVLLPPAFYIPCLKISALTLILTIVSSAYGMVSNSRKVLTFVKIKQGKYNMTNYGTFVTQCF